MSPGARIKVLIVDDSAIVRKMLSEALSGEKDLEVVGTAPDPYVARDKILALRPDVVTLDIEMPRMDGLTFLRKIMAHHPLPVIVVSSLGQAGCRATFQAFEAGAVDVLGKPGGPYSVGELRVQLPQKIRAASVARLKTAPLEPAAPRPERVSFDPEAVVAIGASTGGTQAIEAVLRGLPREIPATLIAQHIPAGFSNAFAKRLNEICPFEVKEAEDEDTVRAGRALVAPGNQHMLLRREDAGYRVAVKNGPLVCYQRPSVDVMFASVAEAARANAVGVILTGMGSDGAHGLLKMKRAGAHTIAQDEASCVVYGMPRVAVDLGAAERVLALGSVAAGILSALSRTSA